MATVSDAVELEELASVRRELTELLRRQEPSITLFARHGVPADDNAGPGSFYRTVEDQKAQRPASGSRLTTTVTCIESLLEMPPWSTKDDSTAQPATLLDSLEQFMARHLTASDADDTWKSDDAAWVYCRVRALGSYLRLSEATPLQGYEYTKEIIARIDEAWRSRSDDGPFFGLQEAAHPIGSTEFAAQRSTPPGDQQYPPNAYLTYWGLLSLRGASRRLNGVAENETEASWSEVDKAAQAWLLESIGRQVAYHFNGSPLADPQQLLWSICGLVRFSDEAHLQDVRSGSRELLIAGLRAFFAQMKPNGDWDIGAPLFHYRNAGNAYSYIYEVLGELFSLACAGSDQVTAEASQALRNELRKHWVSIKRMLERATELGQTIAPDVTVWASSHHPHRAAESWATASAYRMLQSLRRLVGTWCSEETRQALAARAPRKGIAMLQARGDTWDTGSGSVGLYLRLAFLWPIEKRQEQLRQSEIPANRIFADDPDQPVVASDEQARSAILFGPPGTGKTTMVEALAGALGWDFIEITPGRFLDEGLDRVSARADHIFRQIMELDRCVVLLDEIDELIQYREATNDPLERFFTTTMLPRLAALWELGRILFFVNTNDIERVDTAIRRAQRFDAALLVLPPSFSTKANLLAGVGLNDCGLTAEEVQQAVDAVDPRKTPTMNGPTNPLSVNPGWFALMRFDQLNTYRTAFAREFAIKGDRQNSAVAALRKIANELLRLDWLQQVDKSQNTTPVTADLMKLPDLLGRLLGAERRDGRRQLVWKMAEGDHVFVDVPIGTEEPLVWARETGFLIDESTAELRNASGSKADVAYEPANTSGEGVAPPDGPPDP